MKQGWEYKKLGELFPYIKNGANIKQSKDAKGYPITRIETLSSGVFNRDRLGYANIYELGKYEEYVLKSHDLLLSHINSKAYIGRTVEYKAKEGETIIHGMNLLRLKSNFDAISSSYFAYYALSTKFKDDIAKIRKDAVNQSSIAISDLKCIKIPVPPLTQQQSIVAELDKINEIIDLKKAQLKDLDLLAQSIFYEMFGDPIENPKGWEVKKLGEVCTDVKYGTSKPACEGGKYKYLRMNNLTADGHLDLSNLKYIDIPDSEVEKCIVRKGDVLFNRTNSIDLVGKTCEFTLEEPMVIAGYIIRVRLSDKVLPTFVSICFNTKAYKKLMKSIAKGAVNQANINSKELQAIEIPLPSLSLQQSFAEKIQAIESQKSAIKQSLADVETLLASRMDYYFN